MSYEMDRHQLGENFDACGPVETPLFNQVRQEFIKMGRSVLSPVVIEGEFAATGLPMSEAPLLHSEALDVPDRDDEASDGAGVTLLETAREKVATLFSGSTGLEVADSAAPSAIAAAGPVTSEQVAVQIATAPEKVKPRYAVRPATPADLEGIVDVDIRAFDSVYSQYDVDSDDWRAEMKDKFAHRLEMVGGEWMPVLERDGKIVGVITCCPTSKTPDEFESWEKTTNNGTLEGTYDPEGKNVYVVSLSVLPEGSEAKDMLLLNQMSKMLREGYDMGFFESRMPGLRTWVKKQARISGRDFDSYDVAELDVLAKQYFTETVTGKDGKEVPRDRLLRLYSRVGCDLLKVVPNAYMDEPSMNYGVVCVYDGSSLFDGSDLPFKVPENKFTRWVFGQAMRYVSKSQRLTGKFFGSGNGRTPANATV